MVSTAKRKKTTPNVNNDIRQQKRDADLAAAMNATQPSLEVGYSPLIHGMIDFVNVRETVDATQSPA